MPAPEVHQAIAKNNKATLDRLLSYENPDDNAWILIIAFFEALHRVELAVDYVYTNNSEPRSHEELLAFLGSRDTRAKRYFFKLHALAAFVLYGISFDKDTCNLAPDFFSDKDFRKHLQKYLEVIKNALK